MPSTVANLLAAADLVPSGVARWGERIPLQLPGVYVVALTDDPHSLTRAQRNAPISQDALRALLDRHPEAHLDGRRAVPEELAARLAAFWLPDEVILYVGLAGTSVQRRVAQFYRTELGARGPHAGGWFLKTLNILEDLFVHYAPCDDPDAAEDAMLLAFSAGVSGQSRARLHDPDRPIPFANLEWPKRRIKRHGIRGAKDARDRTRKDAHTGVPGQEAITHPSRPVPVAASPAHHTQRVTEADIGKGQIRIPIGATKKLLSRERTTIDVQVRGERFTCRWDPKYGPDKERSGVLGIGRERAARLLSPEEVLGVRVAGGVVYLD